MKRSFLKELGLESEAIDKIMAENGRDIEKYKTDIEDYVTEIKELKSVSVDNSKAIENAVKIRESELKKEFEEKEKSYEESLEKAEKYDLALEELEDLKKANSNREYSQHLDNFFEKNKIDFTSSFAKEAISNKFKEKGFKLNENKFGEDAISFIKEVQENNKDAFKTIESSDEIQKPIFSAPTGGNKPIESSKFGFTSMFTGVRARENNNQ